MKVIQRARWDDQYAIIGRKIFLLAAVYIENRSLPMKKYVGLGRLCKR